MRKTAAAEMSALRERVLENPLYRDFVVSTDGRATAITFARAGAQASDGLLRAEGRDEVFWLAVRNTVIYAAFSIPLAVIVSLTMLPALTISVLKWNDRRKAPLAKAT